MESGILLHSLLQFFEVTLFNEILHQFIFLNDYLVPGSLALMNIV